MTVRIKQSVKDVHYRKIVGQKNRTTISIEVQKKIHYGEFDSGSG
jgi:hypothetical protein